MKAAMIDSSLYAHPGNATKYHIVDNGVPACNIDATIVNESTELPAGNVPPLLRCKRNGCRQKWKSVGGRFPLTEKLRTSLGQETIDIAKQALEEK